MSMAAAATRVEPIAARLADYVIGVGRDELPADVVEKARLSLLDTIGCMMAGARTASGQVVVRQIEADSADGDCTLFGGTRGVRAPAAALSNGTAAHALEFDDGHRPSDNHLGCVVVPAALAAAEACDASLDDLLTAVVVGYDVMGRVGEATCLPRMESPFHGTGTTGGFGAAAAAGRLFGLTTGQLLHALAIAGTGAAGTREAMAGGACKPLQVGRATQNGIVAASLAAEGYEGPELIFEGAFGFCSSMTTQPRPELIDAELGTRFAVMESGFKVHGSCGVLFTAIDAALALRPVLPEGTLPESVRVGIPSWIREDPVFWNASPKSVEAARFSIPFVVATALVYGSVLPGDLTESRLSDPRLEQLMGTVEVVDDPEIEQIAQASKTDPFFFYPSSVEIRVGGEVHRRVERTPVGYDPARPLTRSQVIDKFHALVTPFLEEGSRRRIVDWIMNGEGSARVAELRALMAPGAPGPARG